MLKKIFLLSLIGLLSGGILFAGGQKEEAEEPIEEELMADSTPIAVDANVVASVDGTTISRDEFDQKMEAVKSSYAQQGQQLAQEQLKVVEKQLLDSMVQQILLLNQCDLLGIETPQGAVDSQIQEYISQFGGDEAQFEAALAAQGYTRESFEEELAGSLKIQSLLQQEVIAKVEAVSEEEAKTYYENNPQDFTQPEQVRASHILIQVAPEASEAEKTEALEKAQAVLAKVEEGLDFSELAKEYSEGPSGPNGGDLNYFGRGQMVAPFEQAAFALNVGEVSDVVETQFGYHIIKVFDKKASQKVPYDSYKGQILQAMNQQKQQAAVMAYLEQIKGEAEIETYL